MSKTNPVLVKGHFLFLSSPRTQVLTHSHHKHIKKHVPERKKPQKRQVLLDPPPSQHSAPEVRSSCADFSSSAAWARHI